MKEPMLKTAMTPFPYSIDLDAPVIEARKLMLRHHVRHLPVVKDREVVGLVTDRDIKLLLGPEMGSPDPHELTVRDAYVDDCYIVDLETPLVEVLEHMAQAHIGSAVVTAHGRLAGIFTGADACRSFGDFLRRQYHGGDDLPPTVA